MSTKHRPSEIFGSRGAYATSTNTEPYPGTTPSVALTVEPSSRTRPAPRTRASNTDTEGFLFLFVFSSVASTSVSLASGQTVSAEAARSERIVFLNTDTEPFPNWLPPLVATLQQEPDVGAVGMKLLFPDRTVQHAGVVIVEQDEYPTLWPQHMPYKVPADDRLANQRREVSIATAACLMVRRSAFEEVGRFDEGYWNGYEDVDLCLSLRDAGWRIMYEPTSVLIHHESSSGPERFRLVDENIERLQERWAGRVIPDFVRRDDEAVPHPEGVHMRSLPTMSR